MRTLLCLTILLALAAPPAMAARWDALKNDGCIGWGKRQWSSRLLDTRGDWAQECRATAVTIGGQRLATPTRCDHHGIIGGMWGVWHVNDASCAARWDTPKRDQCVGPGKRQYSAILRDIPGGHDWADACRRTSIVIAGANQGAPDRCDNHGVGGMWGVWQVDDASCFARWDTPKKDHCTARGLRQWSAILRNIPEGQSWEAACGTTAITINRIPHGTPDRCDNHGIGGMWGVWVIGDESCAARWDTPKKDHCVGPALRQYSAILRDVPGEQSWLEACRSTPISIAGQDRGIPLRCDDHGVGGMWGVWSVSDPSCPLPHWDTPKRNYCTGPNERQWSAILRDPGPNWETACHTTGMTVAGVAFDKPTRCSNEGIGGMWGEFSVPDPSCTRDERSENDRRYDHMLEQVGSRYAALDEAHVAAGRYDLTADRPEGEIAKLLRNLLDSPQVRAEGWDTVSFMTGGSGAVLVGYEHLGGYVMTRDAGGGYRCYEAWSNSVTAGVSVSAGGAVEIGFSRGLIAGFRGESNGLEGAASLGVGYISGLHWTTANAEPLPDVIVYGVGGFSVDAGVEYVHTWTDHGPEIDCDQVL